MWLVFLLNAELKTSLQYPKNIGEVFRFLTSFLYHFTLLCGASGCCVSLGCWHRLKPRQEPAVSSTVGLCREGRDGGDQRVEGK